MTKRLTLQGRHRLTQVLVSIGLATCFLLTLLSPESVHAREVVALATSMIWVWGP
jgi:hypothetical protein